MDNPVLLLPIAMVAANLPWLSGRLCGVVPLKGRKHLGWHLAELMLLYFLVGSIAHLAMQRSSDMASPHSWEFYAVTAGMFVTFSFPGWIYRYLTRRPSA